MSGLPEDRQEAVAAVRAVILDHLPEGYVERMQYGMIAYVVPLERYRPTNGQPLAYVALASQKNYMALYLMSSCLKEDGEEWFRNEYAATGKRLDMGKGCVRFRKLDDLPLELVGKAVARRSVEELIADTEAA